MRRSVSIGKTFLLSLLDASIFAGYLPAAWKHSHWLPLLKPGKPAQDPASYRPISLTSVVAKVAERLWRQGFVRTPLASLTTANMASAAATEMKMPLPAWWMPRTWP